MNLTCVALHCYAQAVQLLGAARLITDGVRGHVQMDKLLSYHDVLLRTGDLDLLEDGNWLNDQVWHTPCAA